MVPLPIRKQKFTQQRCSFMYEPMNAKRSSIFSWFCSVEYYNYRWARKRKQFKFILWLSMITIEFGNLWMKLLPYSGTHAQYRIDQKNATKISLFPFLFFLSKRFMIYFVCLRLLQSEYSIIAFWQMQCVCCLGTTCELWCSGVAIGGERARAHMFHVMRIQQIIVAVKRFCSVFHTLTW